MASSENRRRFYIQALPVADADVNAEDRAGLLGVLFFDPLAGELIPGLYPTQPKSITYVRPRRYTHRRRN